MKLRITRRVVMTAASVACLLCISQSTGASTPQLDPCDGVGLLWYKQRLAGPERGKEIFST